MAKAKTYPDLYTHRRRSVLPEEAQRTIRELGSTKNIAGETQRLEAFRATLSILNPGIVPQASAEIRAIGGLYRRHRPQTFRLTPFSWFRRQSRAYGWLFQFHGNGFEREKALRQLNDPPKSAFEFVAIVYRMNDWAVEVRNAAFQYAKKHFSRTQPEIIAEAALFLLWQVHLFARWEPGLAEFVKDTLYDKRALPFMKYRLLHSADGPIVRVLRAAMRRPDLDPFLAELALQAKSAAVRACAVDALLNGRAQWMNGYKRVWINKIYEVGRYEPALEQRPLTVPIDSRCLMEAASKDKSAQVRRIVASALIEQIGSPQGWHAGIAARLKADRNPGVASRMEFYFRKMSTAGT